MSMPATLGSGGHLGEGKKAMTKGQLEEGHLYRERREEALEKIHKAALAREEYLLRKQRKAILEQCRRVAIVGLSTEEHSQSYIATEKLLGLGLEILPVLPGRESYLGVRAFSSLREIPGAVDVCLVYPQEGLDLGRLAREAIEKGVKAFWVEEAYAEPEVRQLLANARVQVVEHESLEREYIKNFPFPFHERRATQAGKRSVKVSQRMTANPVTVGPRESIHDAIEKMRKGHFRHLPVVDDRGKLVGMLSDRDIRLIRPSRAFVSTEDEALQLWSASVRQAAAFDPVTISPDAPMEQAAELMLRWEIGGLPVVDEEGKPVGIVTYTDLLREFLAREREA